MPFKTEREREREKERGREGCKVKEARTVRQIEIFFERNRERKILKTKQQQQQQNKKKQKKNTQTHPDIPLHVPANDQCELFQSF